MAKVASDPAPLALRKPSRQEETPAEVWAQIPKTHPKNMPSIRTQKRGSLKRLPLEDFIVAEF